MIEPCCCERQLPEIVKRNGTTTFLTMGDVTVEHLFRAVSYMAGASHRMTLVLGKQPDVKLMRWLHQWMQRGWTTELHLTTTTDAADIVASELKDFQERITLAVDDSVPTEVMAMEGDEGVVVICGRLLTVVVPGITVYALYHGKERGLMDELLSAIEARSKRAEVRSKKEEVRGKKEEVRRKRKKGEFR